MSKRKHKRKICSLNIEYETEDKKYQNITFNLSSGGIFIKTAEPLTIGEKITLSFRTERPSICFKVKGDVIRVDNEGIAVKFHEITPAEEEMINFFVENNQIIGKPL